MIGRVRFGAFLLAGLLVAAALAFFISPQASSEPDGLDKVAMDHGFDRAAQSHAMEGSPTAGYALRGVGNDGLATGMAGLIGVTVTFAVAGGLVLLVRRARPAVGQIG